MFVVLLNYWLISQTVTITGAQSRVAQGLHCFYILFQAWPFEHGVQIIKEESHMGFSGGQTPVYEPLVGWGCG